MGVVRVTYHEGDANCMREYFSSAVDQVIVVRLTCDKPHQISISANLSREAGGAPGSLKDAKWRFTGEGRITLEGEAITRDPRHAGERPVGVKFQTVLLATQEGGSVVDAPADILITNANSVTLFLAASTSFRPRDIEHDLLAAKRPYEELKARHIADYQRLFHRVKFSLGTTPAPDLPTDERLKRVAAGAEDPHLIEQYFQFGRYLLISCSRPGTMAATLQGLWNDKLEPAWD